MVGNNKQILQWQWLGFAAIAFVVLLVYYPSLMHVSRGDQVMYLGEVANLKGFKALAVDTYDLNRHRTIAPGDELLFRPIVYFVLGAEKFFFGYHFMGWQLVGLLLHLMVVWQMLRLLLTIRLGLEALWATAFFAVLFTNMEMVIWQHINSYMVFVVCLLFALRHIYLLCLGKDEKVSTVLCIAAAFLVACFTYEPANVYALMTAVLLWFAVPKLRGYVWLIVLPVILYALASWGNVMVNHYTISEGQAIKHGFHPIKAIKDFAVSFSFWGYSGFFPTQLDMMFAARNMIKDGAQLIKPLNLSNGIVWAMLGVVAISIWAFCRRLVLLTRNQAAFLWLLAGMMVIYTSVIVLGRISSRGLLNVLRVDLYYSYIYWVLLMPLLYAMIDVSVLRRWQRWVMGLCIAVVIIANGFLLYQANDKQMRENNHITIFVNTLDLLIKERGHEKDFSFYVADNYPGNYVYPEFRKITDEPGRMYSFAEILYPQYFTRDNPKYKFLTK